MKSIFIPFRLYNVKDLAPLVGVSPQTLYNWLLRFDLPQVRFGDNCVRMAEADIWYLYTQTGIIDGYCPSEVQGKIDEIVRLLAVDVPLKDHYNGIEVTKLLSISPSYVSKLKQRGDLRAIKLGGRFLYLTSVINALVGQFHQGPDSLSRYNRAEISVHLNNSIGRAAAYSQSTTYLRSNQ